VTTSASKEARQVPVLIVGAGLAGLSTAVFLGLHGVTSLVAERHSGLSTMPKARGQAPPTMEALAVAGVAERFAAAAPPGRPETAIVVAESVTGKVLHSFVQAEPDFAAFSPATAGLAGQERAEPILAERAVELGAEIRFSTRLESFTQDADGITAVLRDLAGGTDQEVRASYLIAADGHKGTIRDQLGIGTHGRVSSQPRTGVSMQFEADLRGVTGESAVHVYYLQNPALPDGSATIVSTDIPDRWVCGIGIPPGQALTDEQCVEIIRAAAGISDLPVALLDRGESTAGSSITRVADHFSAGRALLAGDAAHLMPPTGGQGGNAAVMDGYHLAWMLAAVLGGQAGPRLLDAYDAERRPYADALAEQQYARMVQRWGPSAPDGTVAEIIDPAVGWFGYRCEAGAFIPEPGGDGELFEDPASPSGRPGTRAPHLSLLRDGSPLSARDLYRQHFVLLHAARQPEWAAAAALAGQRLGIRIDTQAIGDGGLADPHKRWAALHGITPGGAVLIRPDGIIAWRASAPADIGQLDQALHAILRH
jgi:putative polyketide hydroxylase